MKVRALEPVGVELLSGLPTTDEEWRELLHDHMQAPSSGQGVLVLRNLALTPAQLEEVLQKTADIMGHRLLPYDRWPGQSPGVDNCEHLALLGNYKARQANDIVPDCTPGQSIAEYKPATLALSEWHTDGSFLARPKSFIALYAPLDVDAALPPEGGQTRFCSTRATAEMRAKYKNWSSVHSWESFMRFLEVRDPDRPKVTAAQCAAKPDQIWPLLNNRECLYINAKNTKAVYNAKGEAVDSSIIEELVQEMLDTNGVYWHQWKPGDLVLWDNQCLLHAATPFDAVKYERLLYRAEFGAHYLPCRPATVTWGYLEPRPPALTVASGSVVVVDTVTMSKSTLPPKSFVQIPPELTDIRNQVTDRVGPHVLTGPIAIQGAQAGDVLQIDILHVRLRSDWAWTLHKKTMQMRHTRLCQLAGGTAQPEWGGCLECAPFFGVLGVAGSERVSSIPPRESHGGNIDLKKLTAGTTLYLPVHMAGALLFVGDGHARQGDGECCGTALETALTGTFRLTIHKSMPLKAARAENATELIGIGIATTVDAAVASALDHLVDWMQELRPNLTRVNAECLCSVAADVNVTQIVNGTTRGAHAVLQKRHLPPN
jgi:acetamidase/formamidase/alpha-ketoglutarate-dependent taurine dioxygenase